MGTVLRHRGGRAPPRCGRGRRAGVVRARGRVTADAAGFARLLAMLTEVGDTPDDPIPIAIETDHGLWVAALRATGRTIYPINPLSASRYRARHQVSGAGAHRVLPAGTELAQAIRVLARAQQDAVWARQQLGTQIRAVLKDFSPAALEAFAGLPEGAWTAGRPHGAGRRCDPRPGRPPDGAAC